MKVGIALDGWKFPIFERRLTEGGFTFDRTHKLMEGTVFLMVPTTPELLHKLADVVRAANDEAAETAGKGAKGELNG